MQYKTPIQQITSPNTNIKLYIKREDLLPLSFGGNKVRIAEEFFDDMLSKGKNCMVGYGSTSSNLCRVLANVASAQGIPCHIISSANDDGSFKETFNSRMVRDCGAVVHPCDKNNVAETVRSVMAECKQNGLQPYYINGNEFGKGNEAVPVRAYAEVYKEIAAQAAELNLQFDYIFLATGTGTTQAGLLAGRHIAGGKEKIIGILIARTASKVKETIQSYLDAFSADQNIKPIPSDSIFVTDDYLCGGYGKGDEGVHSVILQTQKQNGIPLDPTYTGKAFAGMLKYFADKQLKNKNVLFIHTGGTPLFFDFISAYKTKPDVTECHNKEKLLRFLQNIDEQLPTPLSKRVDLGAFAEKVIANGCILTIENENEIGSAALFYCNDSVEKRGYLTLLGTLSKYENRGYSTILMQSMEIKAKSNGMRTMHLETEKRNTRAVAFYSKCGYIVKNCEEKVYMAKELCK